MKLLNELKIFNLYPKRLKKEVNNIRDFQAHEGTNKDILLRLIEKLRNKERLSFRNLKRLFYNANLLNESDIKVLGLLIESNLPPNRYKEFFENLFNNYTTEQSFYVIKESEIIQRLDFLNPTIIKAIANYQNFETYTLSIIKECKDFQSFLQALNVTDKFIGSKGLKKVLEVTAEQAAFIEKYQNNAKSLISIIEKSDSTKAKLDIINTYFKTYISLYNDWAGGLLNEDNFLKLFLNYISSSSYKVFVEHKYINKVLSAYNEVAKVISKMEPKRGRYWRNKGKIYSNIITKQLTSDLLAVAFIIKDYAFVEFARSGNAIYIYSKEDFIKRIQHRNDWKDKTLTAVNFLEYGNNGTLIHDNGGNWMDKLNYRFRNL